MLSFKQNMTSKVLLMLFSVVWCCFFRCGVAMQLLNSSLNHARGFKLFFDFFFIMLQLNLMSHIEFETRAKSGQLYPTLEHKIKVAPFLCQLRGCYLVINFNFCNEYRLQIIDTLVYNIC